MALTLHFLQRSSVLKISWYVVERVWKPQMEKKLLDGAGKKCLGFGVVVGLWEKKRRRHMIRVCEQKRKRELKLSTLGM